MKQWLLRRTIHHAIVIDMPDGVSEEEVRDFLFRGAYEKRWQAAEVETEYEVEAYA